jgi:hypothetical protein
VQVSAGVRQTIVNLPFLALLTRLLWTPKPMHKVVGLGVPISQRVDSYLAALTPEMDPSLLEEVVADAVAGFQEALSERGIPAERYALAVRRDEFDQVGVFVERTDGTRWRLHDFDDFADHGLYPQGSLGLD